MTTLNTPREQATKSAQFIRYSHYQSGGMMASEKKYEDIEELSPDIRRQVELADRDKLLRLEAVQTTTITASNRGKLFWLDFSGYKPPLETGATSIELGLWVSRKSRDNIRNVQCRSHAERLLLAEHLFRTGQFDLENDRYYEVLGLFFVDRYCLWDMDHVCDRKKIASPMWSDRQVTNHAQKSILPELWAQITVLGSMDRQQIVDHCRARFPDCSEVLLWRAVNALFALHARNLDEGVYPITWQYIEAMAAELSGSDDSSKIPDAIACAIKAYPADLRGTAMETVKEHLAIKA